MPATRRKIVFIIHSHIIRIYTTVSLKKAYHWQAYDGQCSRKGETTLEEPGDNSRVVSDCWSLFHNGLSRVLAEKRRLLSIVEIITFFAHYSIMWGKRDRTRTTVHMNTGECTSVWYILILFLFTLPLLPLFYCFIILSFSSYSRRQRNVQKKSKCRTSFTSKDLYKRFSI